MKLNPRISTLLEAEEEEEKKAVLLSDHLRQDEEEEVTTTPKLSLSSFPRKPPEPPGMATPPLYTAVSIPFQWEEVPGRPRPSCSGDSKPPSARCLELPPRLLNEAKLTSILSPTTVLDGPYIGRSLPGTWSFRIPSVRVTGSEVKDKVLFFGSGRWSYPEEDNGDGKGAGDPSFIFERGDGGGRSLFPLSAGGETKVKIRAVKRTSSLSRLSRTKSHVLASIYGSIKQVVQWRRRRKKTGEEGLG